MPPIASSLAEYGDRIYMVGPVQLVDQPTSAEFETFAFRNEVSASPGLETLREHAPNPHLLWLRGQYVEADNPNANGDAWTAGDLAIASLTPIFQPISVLHDFSSSVGFIADARMLTPSEHGVPRPRIDTILAVWAHRYPQVAEEIKNNAAQGMLAQSMECLSGSYECSECGMVFHRQPHFAEKDQWCEHLKGSTGERSHRLLKNVTFSGVGLIFGTRGARPAFKDAQLEVAELAAMHEGVHAASVDDRRKLNDKQTPSTGSIVTQIQVDQQEYEATVAKAARVDGLSTKVTELTARTEELTTKVSELEPVAAKVPDLEKQVEKIPELETKVESAEADKIKAEEEAQQEKARADAAEEEKNKAALREERIESLGEGFKSRLEKAPTTKAKLHDQAESLSDEEWKARLDELKETLGVDPQAAASAEDLTKAGLFTNEQVAQAGLVTPDAASSTTTASDSSRRRSAIGGLARSFGKQPQKTT